ncbi:hypothetical protein [Alteromonas sp. a30]|uniref:hypothetical protein n=1 Tax=Alteromonas sp. a30 TaxID=2730917 RepID=UPI00227E96E3|nr:hypothetical protein [Alteromonas sp. a30]MCY7296176.1 hypothetical protein [Alteromonas sp. a30]
MKLNKLSLILAGVSAVLTSSAMAVTYNTSVEIDSRLGEQPLNATVIQNMEYPVLGVTDATKVGSYCLANGGANGTGFDNRTSNESNSLCPNLSPDYFRVQFSGVKGAYLDIGYSLQIQEKGGFRFSYSNGNQHVGQTSVQLSTTEGTAEYPVYSRVTLLDPTQVTDGVLDFNFDITAAYQ